MERLSNVFVRQFPGNTFLENVQNHCAPTKRSLVASAEAVTSADVNALLMPRPSLLYSAISQKCVLA